MVGSGGFGVITSSNFFTPQVNVSGSMASFVARRRWSLSLPRRCRLAAGRPQACGRPQVRLHRV
jgi:hypothetical protein